MSVLCRCLEDDPRHIVFKTGEANSWGVLW